ncbi:hypothetical protein [Limnohabitans sp.]|uniref:hypothetical protein n=1 Tax=Limnohabitans sp. TaxID=1907725 RepID=UPI0039BD031B|nr:hypothetical protein [Comamonadaceae bacterium]
MSNATKTLSAVNMAFANSIVQQLDVLSVRRKEWEATDYKKANDGLYALLADCLDVYNARFVNGSLDDQKALRRSLIERLQADGVKVVKTSITLTMLARFVFNSDRKRAQGYGYVLAAAVSHGIEATGFAAWVLQQGGIEEIKRLMVKKPEALAKQQAVKAATAAVKGDLELNTLQPLAHVGIQGLKGTYAVLLVKPSASGGADIVGSLSDVNDALVNALILRMAKAQVEAAESDKELSKQVKQESSDLLAANDEQVAKVVNA